jgi:hypothetical protein
MADVPPVVIRPLTEADLADADRVFRVAFGTFAGVPEPRKFFGDAEFVRTRWHADNDAAFAAVREGRLVGARARPGRIRGRRWQLFSRRVGQLLTERLLVR